MDLQTLRAKQAAAKARRDSAVIQENKINTNEEEAPKKKGRRPNKRVFMVVEDAPAMNDLIEEKEEEQNTEEKEEQLNTEEKEEEPENLILGDAILE